MITKRAQCSKRREGHAPAYAAAFVIISFFLFFSQILAAEGPIIREIIISGEGIKSPEQIRRILPFREGDTFSKNNLETGVNILKKTGLFETVNWDTEDMPGGVRVVISLTPVKFVRLIKFKKSFPLFDSELRRAIRLREGDPFNTDRIKKDEERLVQYLQNQGYFESHVEASAASDRKTGDMIVTFTIKKGFTYNLFDVRSNGAHAVTQFRIRSIMRRHMLLKYRRQALDNGVEDLIKLYHSLGYYEARVSVSGIEQDKVFLTVVIRLEIHEGPRAQVRFRGDRHATKRTLRRKLTLIEEQSIDEFDIQTSAHRIENLYRSRGYRNVKVAYEVKQKETRKKGPITVITFRIKSGPKVVVSKVEFKGRDQFKAEKLQKQILTGRRPRFYKRPPLVDSMLRDDINSLHTFYHSWGFQEARISTPEIEFSRKGKKAKVTIPLHEGPQTNVAEVTFKGMEYFDTEDALSVLQLVPGVAFDPDILEKDRRRLRLYYGDHGFPYAQVAQSTEEVRIPEGKAVAIRYTVVENTRVSVGELMVRGNYRTKSRVLVREVELQAGDPFSSDALLRSRRNLRSLGFLNGVRLDTLGLDEHLDVVHLLLVAQERSNRSVDFGVGYDSEWGPEGSLIFYDLNLLGLGKAVKLSLIGGGDINQGEFTYSDPRFLGLKLRADFTASGGQTKSSAFDLSQAAARYTLSRKLAEELTGSFGMRMEWNVLSHVVDESEVEKLNVHNNQVLAIGPQILYDARNDFIDPSRGRLVAVKFEYAHAITTDDEWLRFFIQGSTYYSPGDHIVLALSARYGHIEPIHASRIPFQEAFFVGGNRSVRGYSEDGLGPRDLGGHPLGGLDEVVTNFEIRFPIVSLLHGVVFLDSGQLVSNPIDIMMTNELFTAGAGLRVYTPVGPIRLDWGYKLEPSPFEGRYRWHFSFGYPF